MATEHIHVQHIEYLVRRLLAPRLPAADVARILKDIHADKQSVLDQLERVERGIIARLSAIWGFRGTRSVHLWSLPFLRDAKPTGVLSHKYKGQQLLIGDWASPTVQVPGIKKNKWFDVKHDDSATGHHRVLRVRQGANSFEALVRLNKRRSVSYEGGRTSFPLSEDVFIHIAFARVARVVEVYASYDDACDALRVFLEWCTGGSVPPRKSAERDRYFTPVIFGEQEVKKLAESLRLANTSVRGRPPSGELGDRQLWGRMEGDRRVALDAQLPDVQEHETVQNRLRWYGVEFTHDDGFVEYTEVEFVFLATCPRLVFNVKTSLPAMDHVISWLCKTIGIV